MKTLLLAVLVTIASGCASTQKEPPPKPLVGTKWQVLLELPQPLYHHHVLISDAIGRKLAKSDGDSGFAALRAEGQTAAAIRHQLGFM